MRKLVQEMEVEFFLSLQANDILFIDSSHITKPQNDVLFLYLEVLPLLRPGVLVHIHDIQTPRDYPAAWVLRDVRFWNEQYLLEAFLSLNGQYQVLGALNYLRYNHTEELCSVCPVLEEELDDRVPGSFWMQRCS